MPTDMAPSQMTTLARSLEAGQDWLNLLNDPKYPDMQTFLASNHPAGQDYKDYTPRGEKCDVLGREGEPAGIGEGSDGASPSQNG